GNYLISQVRDDVAVAYKKEMEWKTLKMLLPYKQMFTAKKVEVEVLLIEADDVADAIARQVSKFKSSKLVIGASSRKRFQWATKRKGLSSKISDCTPKFCTVYAIRKGKLSSVRPSQSETDGSIKCESNDADTYGTNSSSNNFSSEIDCTDQGSTASYSQLHCRSLGIQHLRAPPTRNQGHHKSRSVLTDFGHSNLDSSYSSISDGLSTGVKVSSFRSLQVDLPTQDFDQASTSDVPTNSSSENKVDLDFELEKLKIEIRHARGMYAIAQSEKVNAARQLNDLSKRQREEALKFQEISLREEQARNLAKHEMEKHEAAKREAEFLRECAEKEASDRKEVEYRAARDANEKQKLQKMLESPNEPYKKFTWEEIVSATSSFSDDLKIGMGAYGTVYKCTLDHVAAAVKVLHTKEGQGTKEFRQELDILSKIRHPHLLLLLGACPDHSCLVYEYMENGSLEERLLQKNDASPMPWFVRYRIAWEIASALENSLVGTLCYIDPEYQRSGLLSPKSDVYAFGIVVLQLLTAKPALALAHIVETALENGRLVEILDCRAGSWPVKETNELASLALRCAEIKSRDRPDLSAEVFPVLERLKEIADKASAASVHLGGPPNDFICPLLKDLMEDPCVAGDGYTYDRKAIEVWLKENNKSPLTGLSLPSKSLIPNYSLFSAIMEWRSNKQRHQPLNAF
ncbi:U-box domain-containing protein kinase family protein, partial [Thalictrum thalictroides]